MDFDGEVGSVVNLFDILGRFIDDDLILRVLCSGLLD